MYSLISRSLSVFSLLAALALLLTPALAATNVPREVPAAQTDDAVAPLTTPGKGIPDRYIVVFKADRVFSAAAVNSKAAEAEIQFGAQIHYLYESAVQGYAATLSAQAVEALRKDADVAYIEQDQVFTVNDTQTGPPWGLDRIDQRSLPLSNSYTYATDGQGVHAYIIDTGIRSSHTDFSGRIGAGYDAVDGGAPDDCNGHGTHVAGTVGGSTYGVAKRVTLHGVRVLDCNGSGTTSGVVAGINWVTANHTKPAVANMSLGGGASPTLDTALRNSVAAGVVHVVAAGNENADACNSSPAREPLAITVGATNSSDQRASFSNYGTCLDIFAPGVNILSSWYTGDNAAGSLSGTSMASPHVAGVVALHLAGSPSASPADVAASLNNAATTGTVSDPGSGSPNRLLYNLLGPAPTPTPTPTGTPPTPTPTLTATPTPIPPPNDDFAQPIEISTLPFNHTMATTLATGAADDPVLCIGFQGGASVWYRLVAPASGQLTLNTFNSNYDTVLAVFTGSRGALTQLACNDDLSNTNRQSQTTLPVTAGTTYYVEVADYNPGSSQLAAPRSKTDAPVNGQAGGTLSLAATLNVASNTPTPPSPVLPANDDFAQPGVMANLPYSHSMDTQSATRASDDPILCIGSQGLASVWYRLIPAVNGTLEIQTTNSNYDTVLAVFTGNRGALTRHACNDDADNSLQSRVALPVTAGTIYHIEVAQYSYLNDASTKNSSPKNVPVTPWSGGALQISAALTPLQPTPTATPTILPTATQTPSIPPTATPTPDPGDVLLAVAPADSAVQLGETFTVTVRVQTTQPVDSAEAYLNFDPAVLQVAAVTAGSTFPTLLQNQFDNTQGTFDFAAGAPLGGGAPTSDFVLATILFTATHPSTGTPLTFVSQNPRRSDVYYVGNSVLDRLENGSVRVVERRLVGRAMPPGRPAAPHLSWRIPVTITLQNPLGEPAIQQATVLDASGYFTLTGLGGSYQIGVRGHNTLRTTLPVTVTEALTAVNFGTLRGGDSNGDNAVSLIDFSILVNTFSRCSTNAGYDPRADFNGDGCVNLPDFSILRSNFGISGNSQLLPAVTKAEPPLLAPTNVQLGIALPAGPLLRGTTFVAHLWLAAPMAVDGVAAYLTFDPAILQVNRIVVSELLSARLEETFDNSQGQIRFAAGSLSTVLNGSLSLATIEFDTVGLGSSKLTFLHSNSAQSEATSDGASILADTADAAIYIVDQLAPPLFLPMISGD